VTNKGEQDNFADFDYKIGCHGKVVWVSEQFLNGTSAHNRLFSATAKSFDRSEKEVQDVNLRSNGYHKVKIWWKSDQCIPR